MPWSGWSVLCGCGQARSKADPFLQVPNPLLPSLAGAFLLGTTPQQKTQAPPPSYRPPPPSYRPIAISPNANRCHVRACHRCGALYACPEDDAT